MGAAGPSIAALSCRPLLLMVPRRAFLLVPDDRRRLLVPPVSVPSPVSPSAVSSSQPERSLSRACSRRQPTQKHVGKLASMCVHFSSLHDSHVRARAKRITHQVPHRMCAITFFLAL